LRRYNPQVQATLAILLLSSFAGAQILTGTVTTGTTGKPAAGDEIVLLNLARGMEDVGRTKTDSKGNFSFKLDDAQAPHLVRATHQAVTYQRMAPPGTTSAEVEVYDVGKQIDGIEVVADIMRMQVEQGQLQVKREFAVQNSSKPLRTQMNERNLEFFIPEGAKIIEGSAMTEHGNPLKSAPVQESDKNRYFFEFPLRPGTTHFQVIYEVPYAGNATIDPRSLYPLQHFLAIVPKSMDFSGAPGANFKPMNDPNQPDANVQIASATTGGQTLAFKIAGEGTLQARVEGGRAQVENAPAQHENRSGGGLGLPIDAPDPLGKYRWYILGGIAGALVAAAIHVALRRQRAVRNGPRQKTQPLTFAEHNLDYEAADAPAERTKAFRATCPQSPVEPSAVSMLLEGLKDEIFQLEVEHKQGDISQSEYEKVKAALDQMLERALKRETAQVNVGRTGERALPAPRRQPDNLC
jgi:hypothetical protein